MSRLTRPPEAVFSPGHQECRNASQATRGSPQVRPVTSERARARPERQQLGADEHVDELEHEPARGAAGIGTAQARCRAPGPSTVRAASRHPRSIGVRQRATTGPPKGEPPARFGQSGVKPASGAHKFVCAERSRPI